MTNRDFLSECRKHIVEDHGCFFVDCGECPYFPKRAIGGKIASSRCEEYGRIYHEDDTSVLARLFDSFKDEFLDKNIEIS